MKTETLHQIVDFVKMATLAEQAAETPGFEAPEAFYVEYDLGNGTVLGVSRNPLTGGQGRFFATLPVTDGVEDYGRAQDWQTVYDVADRIATLAE